MQTTEHTLRFRLGLFLIVAVAAGCRDLSLPDVARGRITGVAMVTDATARLVPIAGAMAQVVGSSSFVVSNDEGFFEVAPITSSEGQLIVWLDQDHDGVAELSRSFDFAARGIGPNRDTSLGSVVLRDSATISGQVLLASTDAGARALAGTQVFVLGLPSQAFTNDTGAFVLGGVPEGAVSIAAARAGFEPKRLDGIDVRSGESLQLRPFTLAASLARS